MRPCERSQESAALGVEGGTVGKAMEVLDLVAAHARPVRFGELLAASGHPKATLHRLLQTLAGQGMLVHDAERGTYALGVRLVRLAHAAWRQSSLAPQAAPHVSALADATGRTVHLAQLDGGHVLYLDKRGAGDAPDMFSQAGRVGPAYCTGVGKAMLAHLPEDVLEPLMAMQAFHGFMPNTITGAAALRADLALTRARGHAVDAEEHEPGIVCVAVPILTPRGRVLGALSVTSADGPAALPELESHLPALHEAARAIAREASAWRFPEGTEGP